MKKNKEGKEQGSDGKACWDGFYYAGYDSKNKKDICKPNKTWKKYYYYYYYLYLALDKV